MNRIATVGLAAIVITALGLAASTLAESQSTDPADAVSVDTDRLPVSDDRKADIRTVVQDVHDQYTGDQTERSSSVSDNPTSSPAQVGDTAGSGRDGGERGQPSGSEADRTASDPAQRLKKQLSDTDWLSVVLGLGAVGMTGALAYYRQQIRQAVASRRLQGRSKDNPPATVQPEPDTEIERAWVELLTHAGVRQPWGRTPRDCARIVIETGYDSTTVDRLCRAFEDTQYGVADPTSEQQQLARETIDRLGGETG